MAKKQNLSYKDIEKSLKELKLQPCAAEDVGYAILKAFGKSDADIRRYKDGRGTISTFDGLLIKNLFCYKPAPTTRLTETLEAFKHNPMVRRVTVKIVAVSDGQTILAYDMRENETYENRVDRLYCDFAFFYPLAGIERFHQIDESPADVKAAEKLAKLHDELRAYNEFSTDSDLHDLNIFIARLLFCFFAEDTNIFEDNLFTSSIERYTKSDGSDLTDYLDSVFNIMDIRERNADTLRIVTQFPYVNGGLFAKRIKIPHMGYRARRLIIECGSLDWKNINPDIFGSMIQAVVNPDERANQGMHYTSVPNIMKVINPLFLDDLRAEYNRLQAQYDEKSRMLAMGAVNEAQLYRECKPILDESAKLLKRISKMKFFDPACGSGNFLIITYKSLRLLEMDIMRLQRQIQPALEFFGQSVISLDQFYGIELLDFPHEVAMLSMWLAEHQMNRKLYEDFGINTEALPLKNINTIVCGNACRIDWNAVCPHTPDEEVYVFGNPPYIGSTLQEECQKKDMEYAIGQECNGWKKLDYITTWFILASKYIKSSRSKFAFVSTNSICQGEQVPILWPVIFNYGLEISFAYLSFKWTNNAKNNAGVTVIIIGIENHPIKKVIYNNGTVSNVKNISPYLLEGSNAIVINQRDSISGLQKMIFGSKSSDGGYLILDPHAKDELLAKFPEAKKYIKRYVGADDSINGFERFCIWVTDEEYTFADGIATLHERFEKCKKKRLESTKSTTKALAEFPYKFTEIRYKNTSCLVIPRVSSENRKYIPMQWYDCDTVVDGSSQVIYDVTPYTFGVINSQMHMVWVKVVGGKLETRYRYSTQLCYNTFPFPKVTAAKRKQIEEAAEEVLLARAGYPEKTLAEMYDPESMPADLLAAHQALDDIVDSCYAGYPFANDEARLECLFKLYEKMTKNPV